MLINSPADLRHALDQTTSLDAGISEPFSLAEWSRRVRTQTPAAAFAPTNPATIRQAAETITPKVASTRRKRAPGNASPRQGNELHPTPELRSVLSYDPETGIFRHLPRHPADSLAAKMFNNRYEGDVAGSTHPTGYRKLHYDGVVYIAHRVAWALMTGQWPTTLIDHRNGNLDDNRWANLRAVDRRAVAIKRRSRNPASGYRGVYRAGKRWVAMIKSDERGLRRLGLFDTPREAYDAYLAEAHKCFGDLFPPD